MHTLEELRRFLGNLTWGDFTICGQVRDNPKVINKVTYTVIIGAHLGRTCVACVAEDRFVAIRTFELIELLRPLNIERYPPVAPTVKNHFLVEAWGSWYAPGSFNHEALIVPENTHEGPASDLHTRAVAAAPCP